MENKNGWRAHSNLSISIRMCKENFVPMKVKMSCCSIEMPRIKEKMHVLLMLSYQTDSCRSAATSAGAMSIYNINKVSLDLFLFVYKVLAYTSSIFCHYTVIHWKNFVTKVFFVFFLFFSSYCSMCGIVHWNMVLNKIYARRLSRDKIFREEYV